MPAPQKSINTARAKESGSELLARKITRRFEQKKLSESMSQTYMHLVSKTSRTTNNTGGTTSPVPGGGTKYQFAMPTKASKSKAVNQSMDRGDRKLDHYYL